MKKTLLKFISLILALSVLVSLTACGGQDNGNQNGDQSGGAADTVPVSFVSIEINPSVELTVNKSGVVVSVYGANDDGKILLHGEDAAIVGKDAGEAVKYLTTLAAELGYLSDENSDVITSVTSDDAAALEALKAKVNGGIEQAAESAGIAVEIADSIGYAVISGLAELKEKYPSSEEIQALTAEKYKLVLSCVEGGKVTLEEAVSMTNSQLIAKVNEAHSAIAEYATDAYLKAKARANAIFESSMGIFEDGIYTAIYAERASSILSKPAYLNTIHYGAAYQAYKTGERTYLSVMEIMKFADEYAKVELKDEVALSVALAFGLEDTAPLAGEDGKITLASVLDYAEEYSRKYQLSDELRERIDEAIAEAKASAELVVIASDAYSTDLAALRASIGTVIATVKATAGAIAAWLPAEAKADFEACLADLEATGAKLDEMMTDGITSEEIASLAEAAAAKADEYLEKIEADLTDDEKARAEEKRQEISDKIEKLVADFNQRLAEAESAAKSYIEEAKERRRAS